MKKRIAPLLVLFLSLILGCDNTVDVNAEGEEIFVVYGVLNPAKPTQYIRIARAFLTEGNAIQYAAEADLNLPNAVVKLQYDQNNGGAPNLKTITLQRFDTLKQEGGGFNRALTVFRTSEPIVPGKKYKLIVETPNNGPKITAETLVPDKPLMVSPDTCTKPNFSCDMSADGIWGANEDRWRIFKFESDKSEIAFTKTARSTTGATLVGGYGFEMRIFFNYSLEQNGVLVPQPELRFGPTPVFEPSNDICKNNRPCPTNNCTYCNPVGLDFIGFLQQNVPQDGSARIETGPTPKNIRIELTSMDRYLYEYMTVSNPDFEDFTTQKAEYTNVVSSTGKKQAGIFGAINIDSRYVRPTECFMYKVNLNRQTKPVDCN